MLEQRVQLFGSRKTELCGGVRVISNVNCDGMRELSTKQPKRIFVSRVVASEEQRRIGVEPTELLGELSNRGSLIDVHGRTNLESLRPVPH